MRRKKEKFVPKRSISDPRLRGYGFDKSRNSERRYCGWQQKQNLAMNSTDIGALNVSKDMIAGTPVIFGESDVIKTLQFELGSVGRCGRYGGLVRAWRQHG